MRSFVRPQQHSIRALSSLATFTALVTPSLAFSPVPFLPRFDLLGGVSMLRQTPSLRPTAFKGARMMASNSKVPIQITGNNVEVTPAIKDYVNNKIGSALSKLGRRVTKCDVHIIFDKNPSVPSPARAEVTLFAKGATIRAAKKSHDMYASIDEVSDLVKSKLVKYKERIVDSHQKGSLVPALDDAEIADLESFQQESSDGSAIPTSVPPVDMSLVRKKTFPMDPISVEEAVLCLEYIDHDFYVFKNKASGKVSVVYKRNHGGVGLIEPE